MSSDAFVIVTGGGGGIGRALVHHFCASHPVLTCVGAMCKDMDQSNAASSILLLFMIVDGQWVNLENIPPYLKWLQELSFMGWGVQVRHDWKVQNRV